MHGCTNNAEKEDTTAIIYKYKKPVCTLKELHVGYIVLCIEEGIDFVDMWASFIEEE